MKLQIATSSEGGSLGRLKSQIATSSWGGVRKPPKVFSEQGVAMLSAVLNSKTVVAVSIAIMDAFAKKCFAFTKLDSASIPDIKAGI